MAKTVNRYISELLRTYQEITKKTCAGMALDFDITLSNLYLYRNGKGNPRAKTTGKIIMRQSDVVQKHTKEQEDRVGQRSIATLNLKGSILKRCVNPALDVPTESNDHLFEDRYSSKQPDGKKHSRNVYTHLCEEREEKLKQLIMEIKAEITEVQRLEDLDEKMASLWSARGESK